MLLKICLLTDMLLVTTCALVSTLPGMGHHTEHILQPKDLIAQELAPDPNDYKKQLRQLHILANDDGIILHEYQAVQPCILPICRPFMRLKYRKPPARIELVDDGDERIQKVIPEGWVHISREVLQHKLNCSSSTVCVLSLTDISMDHITDMDMQEICATHR